MANISSDPLFPYFEADEERALGRKATTFKADVTKREEVYAAIDHVEQELGGFDIMVNNAGTASIQSIAEITPEQVEKTFKVNVQGVLWGIQAAAAPGAGPGAVSSISSKCWHRYAIALQ